MAVFASLGSMRDHQQPIQGYGTSFASDVAGTPTVLSECICGAPDSGDAATNATGADRAAPASPDTLNQREDIQVIWQSQSDNGGSVVTFSDSDGITVLTKTTSQK
jgi:hypothetical protein